MTDARERLIQTAALVLSTGDPPASYHISEARRVLDRILSEGCRGDLAEAAGPIDPSIVAFYKRQGRRETALKIADAIETELADEACTATKAGMIDCAEIARSFTEENTDPLEQAHAMDDLIIEGRELFGGAPMSDEHWKLLRNFPNTCDEETTRRGVLVPCEKPAVAARLDDRGHPYPVCAYHTRGDMVSLRELLGSTDE